jgi:deoxyhypusine synthase
MVDCIVTSAGGIEEDIMKCISTFHVGSWNADDKQCRLKAINRIGIKSYLKYLKVTYSFHLKIMGNLKIGYSPSFISCMNNS